MAAERIDVLAVMDRSIEILHGNAWGEDREDLQQARAAVAELIEAAKPACGIVMGSLTAEQMARLRAALARVGEGA